MPESAQEIVKAAIGRHQQAVASLDGIMGDVEKAAEMLREAVQKRRTVFFCGNGGSAADSQHFSTEWVSRYKQDREALPAVALTVDTSALTAIANDYGYEEVFARQLSALAKPGDVLVAFSTSGKSPNIVRALITAPLLQMESILFTGQGAPQGVPADVVVRIPSSETARIQEMHELICHSICEYIDSIIIPPLLSKEGPGVVGEEIV